MDADEFADTAGRSGAGVGGGFNGANITAYEDRDVAGTDVFLADKSNVCSFYHCICRFNCADKAFGLDHSKSL